MYLHEEPRYHIHLYCFPVCREVCSSKPTIKWMKSAIQLELLWSENNNNSWRDPCLGFDPRLKESAFLFSDRFSLQKKKKEKTAGLAICLLFFNPILSFSKATKCLSMTICETSIWISTYEKIIIIIYVYVEYTL